MVDKDETGAIDKAKVFVVVAKKDRLSAPFDALGYMKHFDAGCIEALYET